MRGHDENAGAADGVSEEGVRVRPSIAAAGDGDQIRPVGRILNSSSEYSLRVLSVPNGSREHASQKFAFASQWTVGIFYS